MGTALVFAAFQPKNIKQLELSVLQATVLLAFNDEQEYTYEALQAKTGLSDQELNIQLISMACLDHKLILAIPPPEPEPSAAQDDASEATA